MGTPSVIQPLPEIESMRGGEIDMGNNRMRWLANFAGDATPINSLFQGDFDAIDRTLFSPSTRCIVILVAVSIECDSKG